MCTNLAIDRGPHIVGKMWDSMPFNLPSGMVILGLALGLPSGKLTVCY